MNLKAELRTTIGTSASRKARQEGKIPVAMYSKGEETQSLLIDRREFENILKKEGVNAVFNVDIDGKTQQVLIKDFVKASLKDEFYSVDLQAVSADDKLQVEIPVVLVNEETVKEGIVDLTLTTVLVETTPANIPSSFEIDVKGMEIGDVKYASDLEMPANVELVTDAEESLVSVVAPTEEPEETTDEDEVAEPEVIGEKEATEE